MFDPGFWNSICLWVDKAVGRNSWYKSLVMVVTLQSVGLMPILFASIFRKSRIWLIKTNNSPMFFCMRWMSFRASGFLMSISASDSKGPLMRVNGVRISCAMFVKKSILEL